MNAEDWQQVDKIFQAAVELAENQRPTFLDRVCAADQLLRSELDSLLTADSCEWEFLERPALESAAPLLTSCEPHLAAGQMLGHYEIVELLGKGGMGEVYVARDQILNRKLALKLLPIEYTKDEVHIRRFKREAETISALNHPNIITIHELGRVEDHLFIATELIEGETLRMLIARGAMPVGDALEIAIQTAEALAAAHRAGVIHRDIKPENIMLRPDGYVKVLDFGLAKLAGEGERLRRPMVTEQTDISSGVLMGTVSYMSPEQASGLPVDTRSDIFSLGIVLYEMIAGQRPFDHSNNELRFRSISIGDPPAIGHSADLTQGKLNAVVSKMLTNDRTHRYQDSDELLVDLRNLRKNLASTSEIPDRVARFKSSLGAVLPIVFAIAAILGIASYKFLERYPLNDPSAKPLSEMGTWTTKASISSARWYAEPAVLNDVLYVVGGWNVCTPFSDLQAYDAETDTWTQRSPLITARGGHGIAVLDGHLYAVGGQTDCGEETASVEAYDPAADRWSERSPLPSPRGNHVVATANDRIYTIGGVTFGSRSILDSNSQYDPKTDSWVERSPMPTARQGSGVAVIRGIIYVFGGKSSSGTTSAVEAYDPSTDSWTQKHPMMTPRSSFAVAEVDGIIYAFGGGESTEVEAYDPINDTWSIVAEMPNRRQNFHAATFKGSILFAGGSDQSDYVSSVLSFTPNCTRVRTSPLAPMPTQRTSPAIGEIGGIIYVVGGYDGRQRYLATNEAYDPLTDRWTVRAPMPVEREMGSSNTAVFDGKLFVIGGNAGGDCTNLNQSYDPISDIWRTNAPMPTPRCHVAVVTLDGKIYAVGGTNTNGSIKYTTLEIYNPVTDSWTAGPDMQTGRHYVGAVGQNGILYVVGGWNPAFSPPMLDIVEAYDPVRNRWTTLAPLPTTRSGMTVGVVNGLIVVLGGESGEKTLTTIETYDPITDRWAILADLGKSRTYLASAMLGNTLYAIGGTDDAKMAGSVAANDAIEISSCSAGPIQ